MSLVPEADVPIYCSLDNISCHYSISVYLKYHWMCLYTTLMETNDKYLTSLIHTKMYHVTENKKSLDRFLFYFYFAPSTQFFLKISRKTFYKKKLALVVTRPYDSQALHTFIEMRPLWLILRRYITERLKSYQNRQRVGCPNVHYISKFLIVFWNCKSNVVNSSDCWCHHY